VQEEKAVARRERHLALVAELPAQPVPRGLDAPAYTVLLTSTARNTGRAVLALAAGLHLVNEVSGTAATDVVDGCLLRAQTLLLLELLVEAEHGALLLAAHVSGSASARCEVAASRGRRELDTGGWATGGCTVGEVGGLDAGNVASSAAARVDVGAADGWVRLGDVEGRHFGGGGGCLWCGDLIGWLVGIGVSGVCRTLEDPG
jgi:hypothetical protein